MNDLSTEQINQIQHAVFVSKHYRRVITPAPNCDSDNVHWLSPKNERVGFGYISRKTNKIGLIKCPACLHENYAMAVFSGYCAFCPFSANIDNNL